MNSRRYSFATVTFAVVVVSFGAMAKTDRAFGAPIDSGIDRTSRKLRTSATPVINRSSSVPFESKEGRFCVQLPPGFPALTKKVETAVAPTGETLSMVGFQSDLQTSNGSAHCVIGYTDFPIWMFSVAAPGKMVDIAREGTLGSLPGYRVIADELFDWDPFTGIRNPTSEAKRSITDKIYGGSLTLGQPGRSTFVSVRDLDGVHYARFDIFLDKPRMYSILLAYDSRTAFETTAVKGFFESFHVIGGHR